jgi:hypothetical protein
MPMPPPLALLTLAVLLLLAGPGRGQPSQLCLAAIAQVEAEASLPEGLLLAIGHVESGRRDPASGRFGPWPWTINAEGRGEFFPDRAAAIAAVRALQARGVRLIDVGCMQVNLHFHPTAFATLEDAFDPLTNARYAARFLRELQAREPDWIIAAGHYHSRTPGLADGYRARVEAAWPAARARAAEGRVLAGRLPPRPGGVPPVVALSNRMERAQVIPLAGAGMGGARPGRGLDAYRAQPVPMASSAMAARFAARRPVSGLQ